jgi:hypothetical protein
VRKRFIVPRVNISSVERLKEVGAMGEVERRRKGLRRFLDAHDEDEFLCVGAAVIVLAAGEPVLVAVGVISSGSGRVEVEVLREISPPEGGLGVDDFLQVTPARHAEDMGDEGEDEEGEAAEDEAADETGRESSFAEMRSPLTPISSSLGTGRGAKRILRALGMELLRGLLAVVRTWGRELDWLVSLSSPDEELRELLEVATMRVVGGEGLMRMPGLGVERGG